ncbi:hypothetical protein ACLB1Q_10725 [Escherichia coli]
MRKVVTGGKLLAKLSEKYLDSYDVKIPLVVDIGKGLDISYLTGVVIGHNVRDW